MNHTKFTACKQLDHPEFQALLPLLQKRIVIL